MSNNLVQIDFDVMAIALQKHVREKAIRFNNTIVYVKNGVIVEEDPKTGEIKPIHVITTNK